MKYRFLFPILLLISMISCERQSIPTVTTDQASYLSYNTIRCGGNVTDDGGHPVTRKGVCYSLSPEPIVPKNNSTEDGSDTGPFFSYLRDLEMGTTYYIRAYAQNETGTAYGNEVIVTTYAGSVPVVITLPIDNITGTSARGGGTVTDPGGPEIDDAGICWSSSPEPTTADSCNSAGEVLAFISDISGLQTSTTYYVRAWASNSSGTGYGDEISFTTDSVIIKPEVYTRKATLKYSYAVDCGGIIPAGEGFTITSRGVCWNATGNPDINDEYTFDGTGTGAYTSSIWNLTAGIKYYVRAYATYSLGTVYGEQISFTTPVDNNTVRDSRDGTRYSTIKIGQQWWMAENLNTGISVFSDTTNEDNPKVSDNGIIEKYCLDNKESNCDIYGGLYDWNEMMAYGLSDTGTAGTTQGICPEGWHIPTDNEWDILISFLGGTDIAGGILKESGTSRWQEPNDGAYDGVFFDALPGGSRDEEGMFDFEGFRGVFWSATENFPFWYTSAFSRTVYYNGRSVWRFTNSKTMGYSVRCIMDE